VIAACEALVPYCVKYAELAGENDEDAPIFMPLHRGCVPFMSVKQFETFYWPTLKEVICRLVADGFICRPFAEGDWTMNMKYWNEVPKGKVILHVDQADIFKAKEQVGNTVCLTGNVPATLLELGTPKQVEKYCEKLIDVVGEGGGYILDGAVGIPDGAKLENVKAMTRFTARYGVYKR
jgi:uroporphyrinogen-III decarboxylase